MLTTDYDLKQSELQQIANADAMVGLFTALGYDTSQRIVQTPEAMGFPEGLAREVIRMERVASHDDNALQVYLVELKHLTVALTQAIARVLKSRAGLFLFALTTRDYEEIDFVLFENIAPEHKGNKLSSPQVVIRPRILSVDRRNPGTVSLRVLRRFSYTEIDAYYQWDKLRSAYSVAEWSEPLFNNRALFSDYYLTDRLPQMDEWKEEPRPAYKSINELLVDVRQKFSGFDEAKVRAELLEPIFKTLGWAFEKNKDSMDAGRKPDYMLITPNGKNVPCLAYVWDRSLDGMDEQRDKDTPTENPAQSVVSILENSQSEAKWAIVTNGKIWRLYSAHGQVNSYYEMDLEETLASIDSGIAFRYFWLMFRAKAFSDEPSFVDVLLTESASYAKGLGERLKDKVFEEVFPQFAEGFVKAYGKPAVQLTDDELNEIFHATLTFLYRLLFLLYAESRDLLPVKETRGYWEISLTRMKKEIAEKTGEIDDEVYEKIKKAYSASETGLYDRLSELFAVIDKGKGELNVPVYNGGLFITFSGKQTKVEDETEEIHVAHFLSSHKIPDRYLAFGLDFLARDIDDKTQALVMIDYKSLGVRQLGSIYEGLLEFKLRVAREKMAVVMAKKGDAIVPYADVEKEGLKIRTLGRGAEREEFIYRKGEVYLENDNHERKASGSYYTPDYIVKYIVQNTVGPALEARCESLRPKLREAEKAYHDARKRQEQFEKIGKTGDDPEKTAYTYRDVVNELFDLRVLDPAMGSGHFLVEAVDFITRRLLDFLNAFPWNPVRASLRQTRESILDEMQKQGVSVDPARLTDINLLKRFVLKRCIYGVDLNLMAVELAKVSLWLDCFTLGAPLSFLDHHLRCGNSLIGTNVKTVEESIRITKEGQLSLYAGPFAGLLDLTSLMVEVVERSDATVSDVHSSAEQFGQFRKMLEPYKEVLDLWTSQYFENKRAREFVTLFGDLVMPALKGEMKVAKEFKETIARSRENAKEKRFFHWDLEFPEIFVDLHKRDWKQNPGFDAVIGNPPYVRAENADKEQRNYLLESTTYKTLYGRFDIFAAFAESGISIAKQNGWYGIIIPRSFLTINYCEPLRKFILSQLHLHKLLDFGDEQVFEGVGITCCIPIIHKKLPNEDGLTLIENGKDGEIFEIRKIKQATLLSLPNSSIRTSNLEEQDAAKKQIEQVSLPLGTWCYAITGVVAHDPRTGASKDRLISNSPDYPESLRYIEAKEWDGRYSSVLETRFIRYLPEVMHRPKFKELFESPKLLIPGISAGGVIPASFDTTGVWCNHSLNCCVKLENVVHLGSKLHIDWKTQIDEKINLSYVLACITSRLIGWYHFSFLSDSLGISPETIRLLPIRKIEFLTPSNRRLELLTRAQDLLGKMDSTGLLDFAAARLTAIPGEADVVHDLLVYLAKQMIDLNKQKQSEMKRFLGWLEGILKLDVDEMTGRSKLRNYIGDYQKGESEVTYAELEDILYKNKNKLGISLNDARPMAKIRDEYEKSLAVLRPLKSKLAWTDGLIDQIVYRLYGLTEEEIRIVEGKSE